MRAPEEGICEDIRKAKLLDAALGRMARSRGNLQEVRRSVHDTLVPAITVDNERHYVDANAATQLLFRMSLRDLRERQIEDLTAPDYLTVLQSAWQRLMQTGCASGPYEADFPDGSRLRVVYRATSNVLPGQHLIVFAPAAWPADEVAKLDEHREQPVAGPLSAREREVLMLIASGAGVARIASELTVAPATVKSHIRNIHRKLGSRNRPHAVALGVQLGLIELPPSR